MLTNVNMVTIAISITGFVRIQSVVTTAFVIQDLKCRITEHVQTSMNANRIFIVSSGHAQTLFREFVKFSKFQNHFDSSCSAPRIWNPKRTGVPEIAQTFLENVFSESPKKICIRGGPKF